MTDTCACPTHLDCHPDCACPKLECEYLFVPAELEADLHIIKEHQRKIGNLFWGSWPNDPTR